MVFVQKVSRVAVKVSRNMFGCIIEKYRFCFKRCMQSVIRLRTDKKIKACIVLHFMYSLLFIL